MIMPYSVRSIRRGGAWPFLPAVVGSLVLTGTLAAAAPRCPGPAAVSGITGELNAVSAVSASDAWAVGGGLIMHWNGTSWTRVTSPNMPRSGVLRGVSMVSATDGWAVGEEFSKLIILHWDGTSWTRVASPAGSKGVLFGVSADSATDAWTAGPRSSSRGIGPAQVLHWDATNWTQLPIRVSGIFSDLLAVSAASASDAWIVG